MVLSLPHNSSGLNRESYAVASEQQTEERTSPFSIRAIITALVVVSVVVIGVLFAAYHTCGFGGCPDIEQVSGFVPDEASVVLDRDGEEVGKLYRVNRVVVGLDSLPEHVAQAFVATEDQEFYEHGGVDLSRVFGAAWQNIRSGGIEEGFSTITMQVARNVFPEQLPAQQQTLDRKISEVKVARQLESQYTKEEILELYLNQIYFGSGAWGIQAAAQEYFGKSATELSLGEAALLAGLPQAPSRLNPRENMEGALERRRTVLRRMHQQGYITSDQLAEIEGSEPDLARSRLESPDRAAYFVEQVRRILEQRLGDDIYTEGYRIHTTLDLDAQQVAERELQQQIQAIESGQYGYYPHTSFAAAEADTTSGTDDASDYLQGAFVAMDVNTGDVLAMIGGRDFDSSKFNRATQARRQPGSAFKPFVYAAAIQAGYPPTTILEDTPYRLARDGQVWEPENYGGSYAGQITMRQALVNSKNVATIRLAEMVGLDRVINVARNLGVSGDIPHYPSIAIGAAEVTLMELVAAYATLASLGDRPQPRYVMRVTDRQGGVVWQQPPQTQQVLDPDVAFITLDLMRDVVERGTGAAVRGVGFTAPAAGKTGTTNESADVWFVGFTPRIAAGVWIGMDDPERIMPSATGGRLAAPVWGRVMNSITDSRAEWMAPPGVEQHLVDESGNVIASNCPTVGEVRQEWFLSGTAVPSGCRGYLYGYGDSIYSDSAYDGEGEDSWWRRLRDRIFGDEEQQQPDTIRLDTRQPPRDTIRLDPTREPQDTIRLGPPAADTAAPPTQDTAAPPIGDPVRDTVPPDSGVVNLLPH